MAEEKKFELAPELSEMLGLDSEFDSKDAMKKAFEEKFIAIKNIKDNSEIVNSLYGKVLGTAQTKLKASYKALGVEFEDGEIKDKKFEEIIDIATPKIEAMQTKKFDDFKATYEGDDKVEIEKMQAKLTAQDETWKTKYSDLEGLHTDLKGKFETQVTDFKADLKNRDLGLAKRKGLDGIKWAKDTESFDLKYKGFQSQFDEKYNLDLDAEDPSKVIITNKEGSRIIDDTKVSEFASYESVLEKEAKEAKLLKINDKGGNPAPTPPAAPPQALPGNRIERSRVNTFGR